MKIYDKLMALCVFQLHVWGTNAFILQVPKSILKALEAPFGITEKEKKSAATQTSDRGGKQAKNFQISTQKALQEHLATLKQEQRSVAARANGSGPTRDAKQPGKSWDNLPPVIVDGGSLKTLKLTSSSVQRLGVVLKTGGRPLDADVELWEGPNNTPHKMRVYTEDGRLRPFRAEIAIPRGSTTVAVRNIGQLEFPLEAYFEANTIDKDSPSPFHVARSSDVDSSRTIQGGSLRTYPFVPSVESVQILLETDGRPLNARIELLQGPDSIKQAIQLYTEDGMNRPFFAVIETPGSGNVLRVINAAPMEYPMTAFVAPYLVASSKSDPEAVLDEDRLGYIDFISNPYGEMVR